MGWAGQANLAAELRSTPTAYFNRMCNPIWQEVFTKQNPSSSSSSNPAIKCNIYVPESINICVSNPNEADVSAINCNSSEKINFPIDDFRIGTAYSEDNLSIVDGDYIMRGWSFYPTFHKIGDQPQQNFNEPVNSPSQRGTAYTDFNRAPISQIMTGTNLRLQYDESSVEIVDVGSSTERSLRLTFYDTSYQDRGISRVGVGYDFSDPSNFEAPSILRDEYKAYFLCLTTELADGQQNIPGAYQRKKVRQLIHNIPVQSIDYANGNMQVNFRIGNHVPSYCLLEISHIEDPTRLVYASTLEAVSLPRDTFGYLRKLNNPGTLRVVNPPESEGSLGEGPAPNSSHTAPPLNDDEIDDEVRIVDARDAACETGPEADPDSIECLGYGYMVVHAEGQLTGKRPSRKISYTLNCLDKNLNDVASCFDDNQNSGNIDESSTDHQPIVIANKNALWSENDLSSLGQITEDFPFRGGHFGYYNPDLEHFLDLMEADNLFYMKNIKAKSTNIQGKHYVINKCYAIEGGEYSCEMEKDITASVAETRSTLDGDAKRFMVWKRVRMALVMTAGMMLGVGAATYYSAALTTLLGAATVNAVQATLTTLTVIGVAQGTATLIQSSIQYSKCKTEECRCERASETEEIRA